MQNSMVAYFFVKEKNMNFLFRTMEPEEIKYTYSQSHQLNAQTGCIGHLRGDMDSDGEAFYTSWDNANKELKKELDSLLLIIKKSLESKTEKGFLLRIKTDI